MCAVAVAARAVSSNNRLRRMSGGARLPRSRRTCGWHQSLRGHAAPPSTAQFQPVLFCSRSLACWPLFPEFPFLLFLFFPHCFMFVCLCVEHDKWVSMMGWNAADGLSGYIALALADKPSHRELRSLSDCCRQLFFDPTQQQRIRRDDVQSVAIGQPPLPSHSGKQYALE